MSTAVHNLKPYALPGLHSRSCVVPGWGFGPQPWVYSRSWVLPVVLCDLGLEPRLCHTHMVVVQQRAAAQDTPHPGPAPGVCVRGAVILLCWAARQLVGGS